MDKKEDESIDVQPIQINSPVDNAIVHDSVPILFEYDKNLDVIRTEFYIDLITMNSPTVTIRNGINDQMIIASINGEITALDHNYNKIRNIQPLNRLLVADYNTANDIIAAYGSVTKQVVGLYKKFGHWERI